MLLLTATCSTIMKYEIFIGHTILLLYVLETSDLPTNDFSFDKQAGGIPIF